MLRVLVATVLLGAASAQAVDVGIPAVKLIIAQRGGFPNADKVIYVAKHDPGIQHGAGGDAGVRGTFDVFYTDRPTSVLGAFVMPAPYWRSVTETVATYKPTTIQFIWKTRVAVIKDGKLLKIKTAQRGDQDEPRIDLIAAGPPSDADGVTTVFTFVNDNDGTTRRMCTRFSVADGSTMVFKEGGGGARVRLVAKNGVPAVCP